MVDIEVLKSRGVTVERMKAIFTSEAESDTELAEKIKNRIRDRVQTGIQYNLANYKYWHACDLAWDVPFRQTTYSLVRGFLDRSLPTKDILSALEGPELAEMIVVHDKSGKVVSGKIEQDQVAEVKVNAPTFTNIFIPLVKAYTTIRAAAIVNSYRQVPLFKYEAAKSTALNRTKSEIITDRVELMSSQYGYYDVIKQAVMHMLHYSQAILFPAEQWHAEPQVLRVPKTDAQGNYTTDTEEKTVVVKEGIRFNIPHPSRVFIDGAHRPSTINSDTGVQFGAYWRVTRVGEVMNNPYYWNNKKIPDNGKDLRSSNPTFFNTVYSSCALKFGRAGMTDRNDREDRLLFYTANEPDRAITFTEYFEKINPKNEGIGSYDGEVWFRYCVAGDDTVVYASPLPYAPMVYFGYDALETRAQNSSMALEILPFQDHINNLFSQYLLTIKQNLTNITFFDTNQVDKGIIDEIKNLGQRTYTANNFQPMDMRTNRVGQNDVRQAFQSFTFPHQPTSDLVQGIGELLKVLERILVISPQELAQTASHELTAEEVKNMNAAKSTRYEFTAGAVDRAVYALKVLLYNGLMAYGEEDLYARMPTPVDTNALNTMGFKVEHVDNGSKTALVSGKKSAILVESFASTRDGDLRVNNAATAQAMTQVLGSVVGNPTLFQEVGTEQVIKFINEICQIGGLPRDFRLVPTGQVQQQQVAEAAAQQVQQMAAQIEQQAVQDVGQQLQPVFQSQAEKFNMIEQTLAQLVQAVAQPPPLNDPQSNQVPVDLSGAGPSPGVAPAAGLPAV